MSEVRRPGTLLWSLGELEGKGLGSGSTDRNIPHLTFPAHRSKVHGSCQRFCD